MHLSSGHAITQNENAFTNYRLRQNAQLEDNYTRYQSKISYPIHKEDNDIE